MPSDMAYRTNFGSWGNALVEAGFEPLKPYPSQKCIENMIRAHKGKRSFAWKGGRRKNKDGYIEIWMPQHSNANKKGYILEHRYIVSKKIGRPLLFDEDVHHINGIKDDNRLENLKLMKKSKHITSEQKGKPKNISKKKCRYPNCENLTSSKYGLCVKHYKLQWQRKRNGLIGNIYENPELLK